MAPSNSIVSDKIIREDVQSIIESMPSEFMRLSGKTLLVTGADGFIPSYFIDTVLVLNETILTKNPVKLVIFTHHEISENSRLNHCLKASNTQGIIGDVCQMVLPEHIDIIIHGASKASPRDYFSRPIETADVNVLGTKNLLEYCARRKGSRFLMISSGEIYGDPAITPIPESYKGNVDPIGPRSAYQESKRFAETLCYLYWKSGKVNTVIARLFHTYGPRLSLGDGRVIPEFIRRSFLNTPLEIINKGNSLRTFSYISDSIEGMWRILLSGQLGQAYNVGSEEEISIRELAKMIIRLSSSQSKIAMVPHTPIAHLAATPKKTTPSLTKIRGLGYVPKINLEDGLKRLISWYRDGN